MTDDPIRIGWANTDAGNLSFPGMTDAALAAVAYINEELGGVNGRQLELVTCSVTDTSETNQACGQQFANDDSISMVTTGLLLNAGALYSAIAPSGKPVLGGSPVTPADYSAPNTHFFFGGVPAAFFGQAAFVRELGPETVGFIYSDIAGGIDGFETFVAQLEGSGIDVTGVPVTLGASDVLPQVTAAGAAGADLTVVGINACVPAAEALRTLGASGDVLAIASCVNFTNLAEHPELFQDWYVSSPAVIPLASAGSNDDADLFLSKYPEYGENVTDPIGTFAELGWGLILTLHDILDDLDASSLDDSAAIGSAIEGFGGPVVMGHPEASCPAAPEYPAICNLETFEYQVDDGELVPIS